MKNKYNIALIPLNKTDEITKFAERFNHISDMYSLGKNSLPHVTLLQFYAEDDEIKNIWNKISNSLENMIDLTLDSFSCISFDNLIFWASLIPNNRKKLLEMHKLVTEILDQSFNSKFDPHMTLINTKVRGYEKLVEFEAKSYKPISDSFLLSVGHSDSIGQYLKTIYKSKIQF